MLKAVPAFEVRPYLLEDFHPAFMDALGEEGLAVEADYPVYEVFPFKVRVLPDMGVVQVDDKLSDFLGPGRWYSAYNRQAPADVEAVLNLQGGQASPHHHQVHGGMPGLAVFARRGAGNLVKQTQRGCGRHKMDR